MSDAPLSVTVVGGYLGAGKTTLVNRLLRQPQGRRLGVMVNDFGELAIDAELIAANDDGLVTLANGCVCCSAGGEFFATLTRLLDRRAAFDHLLIEASGVARPGRLAGLARAEPDLQLDAVVTVVDAENFPVQIADPLIADCLEDQVRAADLLLLNKIDLVDTARVEQLEHRLLSDYAKHTVLRCKEAQVPIDVLMATQGADPISEEIADEAKHVAHYARWAYETDGCFDLDRLKGTLAEFPANVVRVKGIVRTQDGNACAIHRVGTRVSTSELPEDVAAGSRLIAIALDEISDQTLTRAIEQTLV